MSAALAEVKRCRRCGDPVPPKAQAGGREKLYCSEKCQWAAANARAPSRDRGCTQCAHCQEKRAARAAWQEEALVELREGRARLLAEFVAFRAEVQALAEEWGLPSSQGEP